MKFDHEKNEHLEKKRLVSASAWMLPRTGSAEPSRLARIEAEAEAMRRAEELQGYRVVFRCRTRPVED
jgi:hypothetical protein